MFLGMQDFDFANLITFDQINQFCPKNCLLGYKAASPSSTVMCKGLAFMTQSIRVLLFLIFFSPSF